MKLKVLQADRLVVHVCLYVLGCAVWHNSVDLFKATFNHPPKKEGSSSEACNQKRQGMTTWLGHANCFCGMTVWALCCFFVLRGHLEFTRIASWMTCCILCTALALHLRAQQWLSTFKGVGVSNPETPIPRRPRNIGRVAYLQHHRRLLDLRRIQDNDYPSSDGAAAGVINHDRPNEVDPIENNAQVQELNLNDQRRREQLITTWRDRPFHPSWKLSWNCLFTGAQNMTRKFWVPALFLGCVTGAMCICRIATIGLGHERIVTFAYLVLVSMAGMGTLFVLLKFPSIHALQSEFLK